MTRSSEDSVMAGPPLLPAGVVANAAGAAAAGTWTPVGAGAEEAATDAAGSANVSAGRLRSAYSTNVSKLD